MDLSHYVGDLQQRLLDTTRNTSDDAREAAERLVSGLDAAVRLVLLDALSAAASEITTDLAPGSVDLRLRGRDVDFVVARQPAETDDGGTGATAAPVPDLTETSSSRTTLRLPDAIKAQVDDAAAADGVSVNTWLVRAVADALQPRQRRAAQKTLRTGDSFAGWAR